MQLDALWTVEYATNHGDFGTGVAVLVDGHIYGGDTNYCYEGTYERDGDELAARVILCLHSGHPAPAFNPDESISVLMRGKLLGVELELTGVLEHEPNTKLFIHMLRKSGVPTAQDISMHATQGEPGTKHSVSAGLAGNQESAYLIDEAVERLPLY